MDGIFICKMCDSEYDIFDIDGILIPEPIFVRVGLLSQFAIIDTRKQDVYARVATIRQAKLITELLNRHYSQKKIKRLFAKNVHHKKYCNKTPYLTIE
jgi:hypothetical protein